MKIFLLSVPYDSGYHKQRLGEGALLLAKTLFGKLLQTGHEVRTAEVQIDNSFPTEITASFQVIRQVANQVHEAKAKGEFPVILAGNCSTSVGTLAGLNNGSGIVWFDCHGDFNTPETTVTGYFDGMSLSMATGHCWKHLTSAVPGFHPVPEARVVLVGSRDFDDLEVKNLSPSAINLITPSMIKENSASVYECFVEMEAVYLHVDLDVLDPHFVKANRYSMEGGLTPDELLRTLATVKNKYRISAVALTAYDPSMDDEKKIPGLVNNILEVITD